MLFLSLWLVAGAMAGEPGALFPGELTCVSGEKIKFIDAGKESFAVAAFCFTADHSYFLSPSCKTGRGCAALDTDLSSIKSQALAGKVGSPGFRLCRRAGGNPELFEYWAENKWWSMDRCLFAADASFVDTGILLRRWEKSKKP